jgi:hypothetical protein
LRASGDTGTTGVFANAATIGVDAANADADADDDADADAISFDDDAVDVAADARP